MMEVISLPLNVIIRSLNAFKTLPNKLISILNGIHQICYLLALTVSNDKPADLLFHDVDVDGDSKAVDVTIVNTLDSDISLASYSESKMLEQAAARKITKYADICRINNVKFQPFVVSSLGNLDANATTLLKWISTARATAMGISQSQSVEWLKQQLTLALVRHQANAIIYRGENVLFSRHVSTVKLFDLSDDGVG